MKRAAVVLVLAILFAFVGGVAFAQSGDTLNIGGFVPLTLDLTVTPTVAANNLQLFGTTVDNVVPVAGISIVTNNAAGWELHVYSGTGEGTGASTLNNADGETIGYTVDYTGTGGVATANVGTGGLKVGEDTAVAPLATPETGNLNITYTQTQTFAAGYYSDQLSIVLRAK